MTDTANITQEAHDALVRKAVEDATQTVEAALATKTEEVSALQTKVEALTTEAATLKTENDRLNTDLDSAQVKLTAATEEVSSLKKDIDDREQAAKTAEIAAKRVEQVKNLKLFESEFVTTERASRWAALTDEAWNEQVEEWKQLKPAVTGSTDTASSAMTGTSDLTKDTTDDAAGADDKKTSPRRAVLALH